MSSDPTRSGQPVADTSAPVPDVLIVSYRRADLLERCLDSVTRHMPDALVHVWDNRSDGTPDVEGLARRRPAIDWTFSPENVGFAAAVNAMARRVDASAMFLLNPDAELLGDLARTRSAMTDPGVAAAAPNVEEAGHRPWDNAHREPTWVRHLVSYSGYEDRLGRFAPLSMAYRDRPIEVSGYLTGAGLLISMDAWRAVGEFDERYFLYGEEADWCSRARRRGLRLISTDEPGIAHTAAGTVSDVKAGRSRSDELLAENRVRYIRDQQGPMAACAYRAGAAILDRVQRSKSTTATTTPRKSAAPVGIVITTPTLGFGGAERQRVALANGLASRGERVQLRALQAFGPLESDLDAAVDRRLATFTTVDREARDGSVLITGTSRIEIAFGLAWRARNLPRGRWIIANHRPAEQDAPVFERAIALMMLGADGMIYLSNQHRADHLRHQRLDRGRWWVVPNGIDTADSDGVARRPSRTIDDGTLRLVTASRLAEIKQVDLLVRALSEGMSDLDWTLDIWGDGPARATVEAAIGPDVMSRIRMRGWCHDVRGVLADSDVLCLPSRAEAQPMTVLEAMAEGAVVVANPVAAVPEMLDGGACGYLVDPPVEERWREVLRDVLSNPQARETVARRAVRRAQEVYSLDAMIDGYRRVCEELRGV